MPSPRSPRPASKRRKRIGADGSGAAGEPSARLVGAPKTKNGRDNYEAFEWRNEKYTVGDTVLLRNPDADSPSFVAEILAISSPVGEPENTVLKLQWFFRADDTSLRPSELADMPTEEVFASNSSEENPLESVEDRCYILFDKEAEVYRGRVVQNKKTRYGRNAEVDFTNNVFFCLRQYDVRTNKLKPYHRWLLNIEPPADSMPSTQEEEAASDDSSDVEFKLEKEELESESDDDLSEAAFESESDSKDDDDDDSDDEDFGTRRQRGKRRAAARTRKASRKPSVGSPRRPKPATLPVAVRALVPDAVSPTKAPAGRRRVAKRPVLHVPAAAAPAAAPVSGLDAARAQLQLGALPVSAEALPCRELEFYTICEFVREKIQASASGCMFVSGVPGTGKTATIRAVSRELKRQLESEELPCFQFVEINAMALTKPAQAYVELWRAVCEKDDVAVTPPQACELLNKRFTTPSPRRQCCVVLLDEVDLLYTKKQDVLYSMFDWPTHKHSRLVLVAVANTMDLPERVLTQRVASRMGLTRQSFLPYTRDQLITILKARVEGIECFDPQALELCSRKVAAVSGDARRALNICRRAAEVSQAANAARVTIQHVHEAIEEMSESPMIRAMQAAADHERLCILAVIACGRRTGVEEATLEALLREHARLCRMRGEGVPSASTVAQVCAALGASRLLCVEPGAHDVQQKIRLNCSADDVFFAYRDDPTAQALSKMEAVAPKDKKKGSGEGEAEEEELIGSATGYDEE